MTKRTFAEICKTCIDLVFPPSEDSVLVRHMHNEGLQSRHVRIRAGCAIALLPYRDRYVRACIHEAKFHRNTKATALLAAVLSAYLATLPHRPYFLIPIPLSRARLRERGYNQVTNVAERAILPDTPWSISAELLQRVCHTSPQTELAREQRYANVAHAFSVPASLQSTVTDAHLILLDDVLTTGATMRAARSTLMKHRPASVICIALAH